MPLGTSHARCFRQHVGEDRAAVFHSEGVFEHDLRRQITNLDTADDISVTVAFSDRSRAFERKLDGFELNAAFIDGSGALSLEPDDLPANGAAFDAKSISPGFTAIFGVQYIPEQPENPPAPITPFFIAPGQNTTAAPVATKNPSNSMIWRERVGNFQILN